MTCLDLPLSHYDQLVSITSSLTSALLTGGVVTLGITSIFLLSTKNKMPWQNRFFQGYLVTLILLLLAFNCVAIISSQAGIIFCFHTQQEIVSTSGTLKRVTILSAAAVVALTDGILVRSFSDDFTYALLPFLSGRSGVVS
jgi:hypothetical protein